MTKVYECVADCRNKDRIMYKNECNLKNVTIDEEGRCRYFEKEPQRSEKR